MKKYIHGIQYLEGKYQREPTIQNKKNTSYSRFCSAKHNLKVNFVACYRASGKNGEADRERQRQFSLSLPMAVVLASWVEDDLKTVGFQEDYITVKLH